jgi:GT2 family glycosyltransferase
VLSQLIAKTAPLSDFVTLVGAERNGGFSYGNNVGLRHWLAEHEAPDYVLLLNPDTIVRKDALSELVRFMDAKTDVGIAGSRLEDPDGTPQCSAFRFPSVASEFASAIQFGPVSKLLSRWLVPQPISDSDRPTDWVAGASMIIRFHVIHELGMLDESYFMYFEEVDYCLRAKLAGWPCWYVPTSHVVHLVGQVSQVTDPKKSRQRRPQYWFESRRRFFLKNHGPAVLASADLAWLVGTTLRRLRLFIERKPDNTPSHFIADFIRHGVFLKGFEL